MLDIEGKGECEIVIEILNQRQPSRILCQVYGDVRQ